MSNTSTDSVRIVLFDNADLNVFLLLTESDDPDNWKLPGGKFSDSNESPAEAAHRELKEEIGLDADAAGLPQAQKLTNDDGVSARYIFWCQAERRLVKPSAEVARTGWFRDTTVPEGKNRSHILSAVTAARAARSGGPESGA